MRLRVLFGVKIPVIWYWYGLQALVAPPPVRPLGPRCTSAGTAFRPSLYLSDNQLTSLHAGFGRVRCRWAPHHHPVAGGSWFVGHSCGTRENGCLSFRALRTERCPRFPAVFACITPRAACATCIQPYRACWILENHVRSGKKNSQPLWDISKLSSQIA